ncbi:Uncharacterized protein M6B38_247970 [Iris pallida]|uniref:Uncharacterized protein n=1 Tax=Iris pallida TaxID=29817 RepID=A0AAX6DGL6_IRIPA|nr:Uncharacterized protein M6B38_247970 [Iris pallida]
MRCHFPHIATKCVNTPINIPNQTQNQTKPKNLDPKISPSHTQTTPDWILRSVLLAFRSRRSSSRRIWCRKSVSPTESSQSRPIVVYIEESWFLSAPQSLIAFVEK